MNLPNLITLSRVPLMFAIVGLMYCGRTWAATLAFALFIIAAVGDWFDGYLARRCGLVTVFGKLMDALTDKIMVLGIVIGLVGKGDLPVWLALVTLCREFLVTGMRMVAATRGVVVAADRGGKSKTLTQLIALGFLLGAPMFRLDLATVLPWPMAAAADVVHRTGFWIFFVGTVLAVWSGARYFVQFRGVLRGGDDQ